MKIILATGIFPPDAGGPATYTKTMSDFLRAEGHDVVVVTYGDKSEIRKQNGVERVSVISRKRNILFRYLSFTWRVFKEARSADLIYVQGPVAAGLPATIVARLTGTELIMKVVGDYAWERATQKGETRLLDEYIASHPRGVSNRIERWTAKRAKKIIVPSQYLKTVVERWGVLSKRIFVVKNVANAIGLGIEKAKYTSLREMRGLNGKTVFLTAVRAVPWKGVSELIEWWADLPTSHVLIVAGDGPELECWKQLAETHGVTDRVQFVGRVPHREMPDWYTIADAFVLHSGYEGYPHVIPEAVSFALPCFISDKGGNPEVVKDMPEYVSELPYQNRKLWIDALSKFHPRADRTMIVQQFRTFTEMQWHTKQILFEEDETAHVVMVSFETQLLNKESSAFSRIQSFVSERITISALIISQTKENKDTRDLENPSLRIFSWRGRGVRRSFQSIRVGIREARRLPGRTIISAQDPFVAGVIGYVISRWTNTPLEIQEHADFYSGYWAKESWKNRLLSIVGRYILRRAERVRVVSERIKRNLIRIGISESKIDIIPVSQTLSFRECHESQPDVPRIIAPCRFVKQKGLDILLASARLLKEQGIRFRLDVIGDGPEKSDLMSLIENKRLQDVVRLLPWKSQDELWDDADLFVLSSRYEGWGRTIVEAMAGGIPIVTTDVGCVGSFFRPQIDGRVVLPNSPIALASAIREQLTEHDRRREMCRSAYARAKEFKSQEVLHDVQQDGWNAVLGHMKRSKEVGPRWDLWILAFILFAILTRATSVALFHTSLLNREWGFFNLVDHWFKGFGYSFVPDLGCASAYRSPGYLFFLTALYSVFRPENTLAQAIVQNIFVVGILWLVYAVGKRLVGKRAALIGGFLMAVYPYTFYHYTQYYHTFLSSFFLLLLVWFVLQLADTKHWRNAIGAGLSIGALAYVQGTILVATPLIVLWLFWVWKWDWKRTMKAAVLMAIFSAGLIAPWTYRNWKELHAFVPLTTDLGFGLYKANNENIYELTLRGYPQEVVDDVTVSSTNLNYVLYRLRPEIQNELEQDSVYHESFFWMDWHPKEPNDVVATCAELGPMNEVEFNAYWTKQSQDWIEKTSLAERLQLHLLKLKTFWQPSLFPSVKTGAPWSFANNPMKVWLARMAVTVSALIVILGGCIGVFIKIREKDKTVFLPLIVVVTYTLLHTFFAGYTKYRIPLDNLMAIYAGLSIIRCVAWVRKKKNT